VPALSVAVGRLLRSATNPCSTDEFRGAYIRSSGSACNCARFCLRTWDGVRYFVRYFLGLDRDIDNRQVCRARIAQVHCSTVHGTYIHWLMMTKTR
jgi:hypothetical protein